MVTDEYRTLSIIQPRPPISKKLSRFKGKAYLNYKEAGTLPVRPVIAKLALRLWKIERLSSGLYSS
jgi:hypothetical protein